MSPEQTAVRDPGSFRDPSGYVFISDSVVYRSINSAAATNFNRIASAAIIRCLVEEGLVLPFKSTVELRDFAKFTGPRGEVPSHVVEQPKIAPISYPYEWTFGQLQEAALTHLDIQIRVLKDNLVLSDATPYNIQFYKGKPVHFDILSFREYRANEPWTAYSQFCNLFLFPLLVEAWCGLPFQNFLRGRLDGISARDASLIIPKRKQFSSLNGMMHVWLQARSISKTRSTSADPSGLVPITVKKEKYNALLIELRHWISTLKSGRRHATFWNDYAASNSYSESMKSRKIEFVQRWVSSSTVRQTLWDIGGNTGEFSMVALKAGFSEAVVLDTDLDSLERVDRMRRSGHTGLLPLVVDVADPSPSLGWKCLERRSLTARAKPDGILALALLHHLAIGRNIPLAEIIHWLMDLAPSGIVEFVPKADPMVIQMLRFRDDVFLDYNEKDFRRYLAARAVMTDELRFEENGRLLVAYKTKV
jgi:ribosomal protein L11 methylase PrmA